MIKLIKYKLSLKIFISFLLIIIVPAVISYYISYSLIQKSIEHELKIRLTDGLSGVYEQIKNIENSSLKLSKELSKNKEIILLLHNKNYIRLKKKLIEIYKLGISDVLEIENTDGKVLLRGHNPTLYGDIKINQSIIKLGLKGENCVTYEKGKSGLAIRAVSPIKYNNKIIGLIMTGSSFSKKLVNSIKKLTGMENAFYKNNKKIIATYKGYDIINKKIILQLKKNKNILLKQIQINNNKYNIMFKPLFLNNKKYWGCVALAISKKDEQKFLNYSTKLLFHLILIGITIAFIIYLFLAYNINKSLKNVLSTIENVHLDKIDNKIKVYGNDEFSEITRSFIKLMNKVNIYTEKIKSLQEDMITSAKLSGMGQLAAGLAHEIRNPLSSIKMMAQIVKKNILKSNDKEIKIILKEIDRINNLVKDLLEYSKPSPMNFSFNNINKIIELMIDLLQYNFKNITLKKNLDNNLPKLYFDSEKMKIVFINLILNALQSIKDNGILKISTQLKDNEHILIEISDSGEGIDEKELKKIFEPYYSTKKEGTGLGLALTKVIIERHFGKIKVKSSEKGTCFKIILPIITELEKII